MAAEWLCMLVASSLCNRGAEAVEEELSSVLDRSIRGVHFVEGSVDGEQYCLVRCGDISDCMESLRSSNWVHSVLESFDHPKYLTEEEIADFITKPEEPCPLMRYGDTVLVVGDDTFNNLYGIVMFGGPEECQVMFKFHIAVVRKWMSNRMLTRTGNVFDYFKRPVTNQAAFLNRRQQRVPVSRDLSHEIDFHLLGTDDEQWPESLKNG